MIIKSILIGFSLYAGMSTHIPKGEISTMDIAPKTNTVAVVKSQVSLKTPELKKDTKIVAKKTIKTSAKPDYCKFGNAENAMSHDFQIKDFKFQTPQSDESFAGYYNVNLDNLTIAFNKCK
jgi:hypothetical protein